MARFSISARLRSVRYALRGIGVMLRTQHNAWIHAAATAAALAAGFLLRIGPASGSRSSSRSWRSGPPRR